MKHGERIICVLLSFSIVCGSFSAADKAMSASLTPSVDPAVASLARRYKDVNLVLQKAKKEAERVQKEAEHTAQRIELKAKRRMNRLDKRKQDILKRQKEREDYVTHQAQKESLKIKHEAEQQALSIINKAEEHALRLRALFEQKGTNVKDARIPITSEWRNQSLEEFRADTAFIKKIILEGEEKRVEQEAFITLFDQQQQWFEQTIEGTQYFFDDAYNALVERKNALAVLVDAQRQADDILNDIILQEHLPEEVFSKVRTLILYELNAVLQDETSVATFMDVDTVQRIAQGVIKLMMPGKKTFTFVSEKEKIQLLEKKVGELERDKKRARELQGQVKSLRKEKRDLIQELELLTDKYQVTSHQLGDTQFSQAVEKNRVIRDDSSIAKTKRNIDKVYKHLALTTEELEALVHDHEVLNQKYEALVTAHKALLNEHTEGKRIMQSRIEVLNDDIAILHASLVQSQSEKIILVSTLHEKEKELQQSQRVYSVEEIDRLMREKIRERLELEIFVARLNRSFDELVDRSFNYEQQLSTALKAKEEKIVHLYKRLRDYKKTNIILLALLEAQKDAINHIKTTINTLYEQIKTVRVFSSQEQSDDHRARVVGEEYKGISAALKGEVGPETLYSMASSSYEHLLHLIEVTTRYKNLLEKRIQECSQIARLEKRLSFLRKLYPSIPCDFIATSLHDQDPLEKRRQEVEEMYTALLVRKSELEKMLATYSGKRENEESVSSHVVCDLENILENIQQAVEFIEKAMNNEGSSPIEGQILESEILNLVNSVST